MGDGKRYPALFSSSNLLFHASQLQDTTTVQDLNFSGGAMCEAGADGCGDNQRLGSGGYPVHIDLATTSQHQNCSESLQPADSCI